MNMYKRDKYAEKFRLITHAAIGEGLGYQTIPDHIRKDIWL